jgi:hypothetical protein
MTIASGIFELSRLLMMLLMRIEEGLLLLLLRRIISPTVKVMCRLTRRRHIIRAVLYGLQVFYSYFLMLVAMTYQVFFFFRRR